MSEKISDELNYSTVVSNHSTPVYRNISPQNSSTVTLSATSGGQISEFIIPPSVFNFSKSRLNFDLKVALTTAKANYVNANLLTTISRVVVYDSATNAQLLDISSFEKYASMVISAGTSLTEFLTKSFASANPATTVATAQPVEDIGKLCTTAANYVNDGTNVASTNGDVVAQGGQTQRRQFYIGGTAAGTGEASEFRVSIPLSAFKFTVLATDRNLYSPSQIILQIYWSATNNFGFVGSAINNVLTDVINYWANPITGPIPDTGGCYFDTINSTWFVDISINGVNIIQYPFFNGRGYNSLTCGTDTYPTQSLSSGPCPSSWETALTNCLQQMISLGYDYRYENDVTEPRGSTPTKVRIWDTNCSSNPINKSISIRVGIQFTMSC